MNQALGHENLGSLSHARGFLPREAPRLELPPLYDPWVELAGRLPALHRQLTLRAAVRELPTLPVGPAELPERGLARAAALLGILAHAYGHLLPGPPEAPPECLQRPWDEVTRRLGRKVAVLSYVDIIVQNWRYRDPAAQGGPVRVSNAELAVPTVGTEAERVFYLAQVELLDRGAPLLEAVARAQEAVLADEPEVLKDIFAAIATLLGRLAGETFAQVDPNELAETHVDPVLWAKTVASLAIPLRAGLIGPSGASSPLVHVLDALFERHVYKSSVGHESLANRHSFPEHWQRFIRAVGSVSVRDYVEERGDPSLLGLFNAAFYAYASDHGFLGRHRLKVYGFLDLAFKVGRNQTNSGFTGLYRERPWDTVDDELERARLERLRGFPPICHRARVARVTTHGAGERGAQFKHVVLDVAGAGIRYEPGDRVGVLPDNSPELVQRTLRALGARGDVLIPLNREWKDAVRMRAHVEEIDEDADELSLRQLLTWGQIRPVARAVAKGLHRLTRSRALHRILEARAEDQWELWDLLELLARGSFDARRLWRAGPGEQEYICRFVRPLPFRMYSIASAMRDADSDEARELHLTVGALRYETRATKVSRADAREGTASSFLGRLADAPASRRVALQIINPPRFGLPLDAGAPLVMFAAGTGLAPFFGFLDARRGRAAPDWLFYATRSRASFLHRERIERLIAEGRLQVRVAFSRDDVEARYDELTGRFEYEPGARHRVDVEIARPDNAARLRELLRDQASGGRGAYLYVCGQTGFASAVMRSIKRVLEPDDPALDARARAAAASHELQRLVATGRYQQEIFSTYEGPQSDKERLLNASDVVLRNNPSRGYWMILNGLVYDVTEFAGLHPGGAKIIASYAGIDATQAYRKVEHHLNAEVDAMRGMYEIGAVRRLDFGGRWGVTLGATGLEFVPLADVYRRWIRYLYRIVEMENALRNDLSLRGAVTTLGEPAGASTPYKAALAVGVHARFMHAYLDSLVGPDFDHLWAMTAGLCSRDARVRQGGRAIAGLRETPAGRRVDGLHAELDARVRALVSRGDGADPAHAPFLELCDRLGDEDLRFLEAYKRAARDVVIAFEQHERETLSRGAALLLAAIVALPDVLKSYYDRVTAWLPEALTER
ncbi:MAG: hypothetical protein H6713_34530 [Myxococcales bacterium]|nr:hypothetical protein [Myxococcales bacterium]